MTDRLSLADAPDFLSVAEVARVLGVSAATVRTLIRDGKLPTVSLGIKQFIVAKSELAKLAGGDS